MRVDLHSSTPNEIKAGKEDAVLHEAWSHHGSDAQHPFVDLTRLRVRSGVDVAPKVSLPWDPTDCGWDFVDHERLAVEKDEANVPGCCFRQVLLSQYVATGQKALQGSFNRGR
jgi:hypothetical protein